MFKNYWTIAWRMLVRNRLYTLINILSLSLGICGCIVIWLVAHYEFGFDRWEPDAGRIYRVGNLQHVKSSYIIPPMTDAIRRSVPGVEAVSTVYTSDGNKQVTVPASAGRPEATFTTKVDGQDRLGDYVITDDHWFSIFPHQWLAGSLAAFRVPFAVVLTEGKAKQYFGSLPVDSYIGKELVFEDSLRVRVAGIVNDWNANTDMPYSEFISFATINASFLKTRRPMNDWNTNGGGPDAPIWPRCFVKLEKGVSPQQVSGNLVLLSKRVVGADKKHPFQTLLQPLTDIHFNADFYDDETRKAHAPTLYALMGIAIFILVLGMVNFVNLTTAQSIQRAKEIGVRKVLGSGRSQIMKQFFTETMVIAVLAVLLAALLVRPVMAWFGDYIPAGLHFHVLDPSTLLFLVGITAVTTLLAGFYPARVLAAYLPALTLKGGVAQTGHQKGLLRKCLIVCQFSISLVFIIVALLMGNQIRYMLKTDYGFKTDAIVTIPVSYGMFDTTSTIKVLEQGMRQLPGVASVVRESDAPLASGYWFLMLKRKAKEDISLGAMMNYGNEQYVPFYGMNVVAGRNLRQGDTLREFVINETAARKLQFKHPSDAIGQLLYVDDHQAFPIVGVVSDFHQGSFKDPIISEVIGHVPGMEHFLGVRLASASQSPEEVHNTLSAMEKVYKGVYPDGHFTYHFLDEDVARLYETEQKTAALVRAVMSLAIFISCMGLFGLALFTARRRAAEISIRKVLGASTADILHLLNKGFVVLVLLSLVIASPIAWWLTNRWLQNFAYREPIAWWVFPLAGASALLIALLTVSFQSIKAAMANPVKYLRQE
jgi:putative ABC transport system permease protein